MYKLQHELEEARRQHVAEIFALQALSVAEIRGVELGLAEVAAIVATLVARQTPEALARYEEMPWEEAIGKLAVELRQFYSSTTICVPTPQCPQQ